jgi:hypothetical protein
LLSEGTRTLGTRNTADFPEETQASPIARKLLGAGWFFQFFGSDETPTSVTSRESKLTGIAT